MSQPPEGRVPTPGEKLADGQLFCLEKCDHQRCAFFRELAESRCVYCGDELGPGVRYYGLMCGVAHTECHGKAGLAGNPSR